MTSLGVRPGSASAILSSTPTLNVLRANEIDFHLITVTNDILKKLFLIDRPFDEYSLDTVKMFSSDARAAGFPL